MPHPPVNVFSARCDPEGVLTLLRRLAPAVRVTEEVEGDWRALEVEVDGLTLPARHAPRYYAGPDWPQQLRGLIGYLLRFPPTPSKPALLRAVRSFRFALAFPGAEVEMASRDPRVSLILQLTRELDGVIFTPPALYDAEGRVLLEANGYADASARVPRPAPPHESFAAPSEQLDLSTLPATRAANLSALSALGFRPAAGLPFGRDGVGMRSVSEIAHRLMALDALFTWASQEGVASERVMGYVARNQLAASLTEEERAVVTLPREAALERRHQVGWRLENMWPLAWALGFARRPEVSSGMIDGETIQAMGAFLPRFDDATEAFVARVTPREEDDVVALEDLFYCAHNAVRSAQLGDDTVPDGFDPVADGGTVHERRHALTWMVSPGVSWDETDLST